MKKSLQTIITKITKNSKSLIKKSANNIKFEGLKNGIIKIMYNSMLEKKRKEKDMFLLELNNIKLETEKLDIQINIVNEDSAIINKNLNALTRFQNFLLNNP